MATTLITLRGGSNPLTVTLTGTRASHAKTFSPALDAKFSMGVEEYQRFRMGVATWMLATAEYTAGEMEDVMRDAQTVATTSSAPRAYVTAYTHPVPHSAPVWPADYAGPGDRRQPLAYVYP